MNNVLCLIVLFLLFHIQHITNYRKGQLFCNINQQAITNDKYAVPEGKHCLTVVSIILSVIFMAYSEN